MRILVANELRSYREAFAKVFHKISPHIEARAIEPQNLEREALRARPDLVVLDRITPAVEAATRFWIEHNTDGGAVAASTNVPGASLPADNVELADLLSVIDRLRELPADAHHANGRAQTGRGRTHPHEAEGGEP